MKTITTKCGVTLRVGKIYPEGNKFFGKIMVYQYNQNSPSRFTVDYFNSIVEDKDKI
jgi:hypothetical protein